MESIKLFDLLKDEMYKLMLDLTKEHMEEYEKEAVKKRFEAVDQNELFKICHEHELDGVVGANAMLLGLTLPDQWKKEYDHQKARLEFFKNKAIEICNLLNENGIPMVILKNGGIMIGILDNTAKCPMEDIDSLVKKKDFLRAHEILVKNGFNFKFRSEYEMEKLESAYRDGSTEYYITTPDGEKMWFELAWRPIAGRWIRPDLEPDTDAFIDRSYSTHGNHARILAPEDNLLQVCIHTAKHSYVRAPGLRLHMDVDRIVSHTEIDWDIFLEKVRQTHVKTSTYLSLYIPSIIFGTPIPERVLNELRPKNEKKLLVLLGNAGLPHPKDKKFNKLQFLRFQTALYDSMKDVFHVIYPNKQWMMERYNCKNRMQILSATIARGFDLVGIRKKK